MLYKGHRARAKNVSKNAAVAKSDVGGNLKREPIVQFGLKMAALNPYKIESHAISTDPIKQKEQSNIFLHGSLAIS
jgi:hypothetical protein